MTSIGFNRVQSPTVQGTITRLIAVVVALFVGLSTGAESGNLAFEKQNYEEASEIFQREIDQNGPNANLLFNLGNAHFKLGKYGAAIYDYERALVLAPRASDIRNNLAQARKAVAAYEEENSITRRLVKILAWFSLNEWLSICGFAICILAVASVARSTRWLEKLPFSLSLRGPVAVAWILLIIGLVTIFLRYPELNRAIVVADSAPVRLSPFATADVKMTLKSGQAVQIEKEHEGFYRITSGWVSKDEVKPIILRK